MRFTPFEGLTKGTLVRRYKRFLADIHLDDGTQVTAHCPNSGSMMGLDAPGAACLVRHVDDPKRKLKWTWEMVQVDGTWVGINTMRPNEVMAWAIETGQVPGLSAEQGLRREVPYGTNSRIDVLLGDDVAGLTYVEIKNTTLSEGPTARFPDAVTARGAKHMDELATMVDAGHRAVVVFFVNRADCDAFAPASDIDPHYAARLRSAIDAGVEVIPVGASCGPDGWTIRGVLPWNH